MPTDRLSAEFIHATPINFSFGEGYGETWETVQPDFDEWSSAELEDYLTDLGYEVPEIDLDKAVDDWYLDEYRGEVLEAVRTMIDDNPDAFAPMMNYLYPIRVSDESAAQSKLIGLPVVVVNVKFNGEWDTYLALSGGGMDLSWEICEAYMRLGYLPPLHFCDLPDLAGKMEESGSREIVDACLESVRVSVMWAESTRRRLNTLLEEE